MNWFPEVEKAIPFEGPRSKNPLAFEYYEANQTIGDKTMEGPEKKSGRQEMLEGILNAYVFET